MLVGESVITKIKGDNWFGHDYNLNVYRGCSHGCIYCDSRSECYGIKIFDTVMPKDLVLETVKSELQGKKKSGVIGTGAMSDPYNPLERELMLSRGVLELINFYGFGVSIATKSPLITRDLDLLKKIAKHSPVLVKITITTFDDELCKKIEPHVAFSSERFHALKQLSDHGIYCGILLMPVLPFINDTEENVLAIANAAKENGAKFIYPAFGVTMRDRNREYMFHALDQDFKGLKEKYIAAYGNSYECVSPNASALHKKFRPLCNELGILTHMKDIIKDYKLPYQNEQISLF